eukprot:scaffold8671_cov112-Skeletonema_dohrnii-CCMP3373.AAC.1
MIINGSFSISSHQIGIVLHIATTQFECKANLLDPLAGWEMRHTFYTFIFHCVLSTCTWLAFSQPASLQLQRAMLLTVLTLSILMSL